MHPDDKSTLDIHEINGRDSERVWIGDFIAGLKVIFHNAETGELG